jgi:hypothetical protein
MKRYLVSTASIAALVLGLAFPVVAPAAMPAPRPQTTTSASAAQRPHQQIRDAIASLRTARDYLEGAPHDFGGHRAVTIRAIDESLRQLQLCQGYDQ